MFTQEMETVFFHGSILTAPLASKYVQNGVKNDKIFQFLATNDIRLLLTHQ